MGLLAGTWLSIAHVTLTAAEPGATSDALGLFPVAVLDAFGGSGNRAPTWTRLRA